MKIQWLTGKEQEECPRTLLIPPTFPYFEDDIPQKMTLHFGAAQQEVSLVIEDDLPDDALCLSPKIFQGFTIPKDLSYDIILSGDNLYLGPVIGILTPSEYMLNIYKKRFTGLHNGDGILFLFTPETIQLSTQTIKGWYYQPNERPKNKWKPAILPYPAAVYSRTRSSTIPDDFKQSMKGKLFNSSPMDKWKFWTRLTTNPDVRPHIPHTEKLTSHTGLNEMIEKYGGVYIKPIRSQRAVGMYHVKKSKRGYHFMDKHKNKFTVKHSLFPSFVKKLKRKTAYVLQQPVPKKFKQRNLDFRVIMQKEPDNQWECSGMIARFSPKGGAITSYTSQGFLTLGHKALSHVFPLTNQEAKQKEQEVIALCKQACQTLDKYGVFADLGIDVIVDDNLNSWILEMNTLHNIQFPSYLPHNKKMTQTVKEKPLAFAKSLAGFAKK